MVRLILCWAKRYWSQDNCELTFENQSVYEGFQRENIILIMSHLLSVTPPANFMSFTSQCSVVVARNNRFCNDCSKLAQLLSFLWKQAKLLVSIEKKRQKKPLQNLSQGTTLISILESLPRTTKLLFQRDIIVKWIPLSLEQLIIMIADHFKVTLWMRKYQ